MKLILERFRQFEKDLIKEKYRDTWSHSAARKGRQQMRPVSAGGEPVAPHLKNVTQTLAKHVLMMVDPTGVSAYPDVADSYKDMTKDPSLGNVSLFALNTLAAIPVIGLIGKPFKALTIAKKIAGLKKARKTLKGTTELVDSIKKAPDVNQGLVTKLDDALKTTEETLVKAEKIIDAKKWKEAEHISSQPPDFVLPLDRSAMAQTARRSVSNFKGALTKHIRGNIPISKEVAQNIIKKFPNLKVAGETVYRGMRVDADYILKHYGDEILNKGPGLHVVEVNKKFKPRSGASTSSWSLDFDEASVWAQGGVGSNPAKYSNKPFEIIFVGGKNSEGLNISAAAEKLGHAARWDDQAEVAMMGAVNVERVIIVSRQGMQKGQHVAATVGQKISPGFYPAGSREEILKLIRPIVKEVLLKLLKDHRYLLA